MRSKSSERSHRRQSSKGATAPASTTVATTTQTIATPSAVEAAVAATGANFSLGDLVICRYSTYPYWPATIDVTHQKKYHHQHRCMQRTRGGDMVLAYWCTFSNDDTGGWVRFDRIVPYHPKLLDHIRLPKSNEMFKDHRDALKAAQNSYNLISSSSRPALQKNLPKDFSAKHTPDPDDADMLLSDDEADTGAADDITTSGPNNADDNDDGDDGDDVHDDDDDRNTDEKDRLSVDRINSHSRPSKSNSLKGKTKGDDIDEEINGNSRKPSKRGEDHAIGDTNTKVDNRRRQADSGDEYSVGHGGDDDGGDDPMDLGHPSSDEEETKPPPPPSPPRPTKQKRESSGRGGRGRGRGGGRRSTGTKRKLKSTPVAATSPTNATGNTSAGSTPLPKRARTTSAKNSAPDKGDETSVLDMGRGARRREQQRETEELRAELDAARSVISHLKEEVAKQKEHITTLEHRPVEFTPPPAPGPVPLKKPPREDYQSKKADLKDLEEMETKLEATFDTFKVKVRAAQKKREELLKRADGMRKEFLEGCKDLEEKEAKAVKLESEIVAILYKLITLDINVIELRPMKLGLLVRSISRTCKQMPAIRGLSNEIHQIWRDIAVAYKKGKGVATDEQSNSGDEDRPASSDDDNESDDDSDDSRSESEGNANDKDEDKRAESEKGDIKMENVSDEEDSKDNDDRVDEKRKSKDKDADDDDGPVDNSKDKLSDEEDDETVPDGQKDKTDSDSRITSKGKDLKLEEDERKNKDVKERDKTVAGKTIIKRNMDADGKIEDDPDDHEMDSEDEDDDDKDIDDNDDNDDKGEDDKDDDKDDDESEEDEDSKSESKNIAEKKPKDKFDGEPKSKKIDRRPSPKKNDDSDKDSDSESEAEADEGRKGKKTLVGDKGAKPKDVEEKKGEKHSTGDVDSRKLKVPAK